jgi:hypothetical protein
MTTTTITQALVDTLTSDIDNLYVLDQQIKALEIKIKKAKADIANKYGEGKHEGQLHSVTVSLVAVSGTVDYKKLCTVHGISEDVQNTFRKEGRADIRVAPAK